MSVVEVGGYVAPVEQSPRKRLNGKLLVFHLLFTPLVLVVYWTINAQGARLAIPLAATKLYRVPGAALLGLGRFKLFHELDIAPFLSILILLLVLLSMTKAIKVLLYGFTPGKVKNEGIYQGVVFFAAAALALLDGILFYRGLMDTSLFGGMDGWALLLTVCISVALAFSAFLHVTLKYGD